jgi:CRISPR/Cas system CMR-associated protein Cmr5 small subunit
MGHKVMIRQKQRLEQKEIVNDAKRQVTMVSCPPRQVAKMSIDNFQNNARFASRQEYIHEEENDVSDDDDEEEVRFDVPSESVEQESDDDIQDNCDYGRTSKLIIDLQEKENKAKQTYNSFCEKLGTMDNRMVLQETVRRATRKYAWKIYKLVDDDDYQHDSPFALFVFESLGIDKESMPLGVQRQELWIKFKKYVCEGMQAARSSATQAIKKQFIGEYKLCCCAFVYNN